MRFWIIALAAMAIAAPSLGAAPSCAGEVEIGDAHIMRIEKNGVLVMTDGRALKLEGVRLPAGAQDHAPQVLADRAFAELEALAKGRELDARASYPKEDRYDRVRSQIFTSDGTWLQLELLKKGLARVELSPDRGECNRELYAAEFEAQKAKLGLWAEPAYATRSPDQLGPDLGTFQIVIGRVVRTFAGNDGAVVLMFGPQLRSDFSVRISAEDVKTFKNMGVDPLNYEGKLIRLRGLVQSITGAGISVGNPPIIAVGNPKQIELLQ